MTDIRRLVVEIELTAGEQPLIEGWAWAPDLPASRFSGWSELFAALQALVSGCQAGQAGDGAGNAGEQRLPGDQDESPR